MKRLFYAWLPPFAWMAVIFALSTRQRLSVSDEFVLNFLFFKTLHVIEYAFLFLLYYRGFGSVWGLSDNRIGKAAFLATIIYAITDEVHQTLVPTREGALRDVIIDALGASLSWISVSRLLPNLPPKLKNWANVFLKVS
jgi:VanZ family protein